MRWSRGPRMRTHVAPACSGRSAVLVRRVQARSGGSAPRRADPTAPYLPSSADSAARQIWRMIPAHQASSAGLPCTRRVGSMRGNVRKQWEHARIMLGHVVHMDSLPRESVSPSGNNLQGDGEVEAVPGSGLRAAHTLTTDPREPYGTPRAYTCT